MLDLHQRREGTIDAWFDLQQYLHERFSALHETNAVVFPVGPSAKSQMES